MERDDFERRFETAIRWAVRIGMVLGWLVVPALIALAWWLWG